MRFGSVGFGEPADVDAELLAEARVHAARRNTNWSELDESALVRRKWWLVHSETDELFQLYRGPVWEAGTAAVVFQDRAPMFFYVRDANVVFLERSNPRTWSEVVARRARHKVPA